MKNTDKIIKILHYGGDALTQAAEKGSYIHDPYKRPISEIGYDPGEPYDEPQIHSIFKMAEAESKPIKRNGYIVGFEIGQPDTAKLKKTKDLLSFTENMVMTAAEHGKVNYSQNEKSTVNIKDIDTLKFLTDTLYRAGFKTATVYDVDNRLTGLIAYDEERFIPKETWRGVEIVSHTDDILSKFKKTDVYAIVKDPTKSESKIYWDVRNTKANNDEKVIQQAESWKRTVDKIIDNGKPTLPNVTIDQLIDVPLASRAERIVPPIVMETYRTVQNGHGLDEVLLEQSVRDLTTSNELQQ